ncbi:MAG: hypothetical protein QOI95_3091 [Acidimicrobiaceae bacterium]|jgi:hypothetical protein
MRWARYIRTAGDDQFGEQWEVLARDPVLVVTGGGFDPRVPRALRRLLEVAKAQVDVVRIELTGATEDPEIAAITQANRTAVDALIADAGGTLIDQPFPSVQSLRSAGVNISRAFHEAGYLDRHKQILVDVSGLPRSVYFPLVLGLLRASATTWDGDLHVVACDSHEVDSALIEEGAEAPGPLGGFAGPTSDSAWATTIWIPVLGEGMSEQLAALLDAIGPEEVVPVLPFPSADPRRGDNLVLEHRELLTDDRFAVESRNYIYASEANPFDLYRAITDLHDRYQSALRILGAAKFVLSTHSSKLLSIGVLLAAYENGLEVMHVSPSRYGLRAGVDVASLANAGQLVDLWLAGEPYR